MTDTTDAPSWERADFRRPSRLSRDQIRSLDIFHETFVRRLATGIGTAVRTTANVELIRTTQMTWEDYLRTLPNYTVLMTIGVAPLPAGVMIEADTSIALALVDRLLGGRGLMAPPRRPSELEVPPLRRLAGVCTTALGDALEQFAEVHAVLESLDFSSQFVALTAPTNMVLVLSYGLTVAAAGITGDITVCLPLVTLTPALAKLVATATDRLANDEPGEAMEPIVRRIPLTIEARLNATDVPASKIAALSVGDVIVLDHRISRPATAVVEGTPVFTGHLGRRGRRFALSVDAHRFDGPSDDASQHGSLGSRAPGQVHDGRFEERHDA